MRDLGLKVEARTFSSFVPEPPVLSPLLCRHITSKLIPVGILEKPDPMTLGPYDPRTP